VSDLSLERLFLFASFVFPGFVSIMAHRLRLPQKETLLKDQMLEAVAFSLINFALVVWPAYQLTWPVNEQPKWWHSWLAVLLAFAVSPFFLGWTSVSLRKWAALRGWVIAAEKTAFDWAFGSQRGCWIKVRLNDDSWVGGRFDKITNSFASAFPEPGHLFIGQLWGLDDTGNFTEPLKDAPGLVLRPTDYKYVYVYFGETG
jgi:hypothetical protein